MSQGRAARLEHATPRPDVPWPCFPPRRCPMSSRYRSVLALCCGLLNLLTSVAAAAEFHPARIAVSFSPNGGATDAVIREVNAAEHPIPVQAYSFTSAPIAKALIAAHKRGLPVHVLLDKSNETATYTAATFMLHAGIPTLIDDHHAIAQNKIMIIDHATVLEGSFNFTKAAEAKNAEN